MTHLSFPFEGFTSVREILQKTPSLECLVLVLDPDSLHNLHWAVCEVLALHAEDQRVWLLVDTLYDQLRRPEIERTMLRRRWEIEVGGGETLWERSKKVTERVLSYDMETMTRAWYSGLHDIYIQHYFIPNYQRV
jgi:hypothetical protein